MAGKIKLFDPVSLFFNDSLGHTQHLVISRNRFDSVLGP